MNEFLYFAAQHRLIVVLLAVANILPAGMIAKYLNIRRNKLLLEAMGERNKKSSLYTKCMVFVRQSVKDYEKREKKAGIYLKARDKMKKAGYASEYSAATYLMLKYLFAGLLFLTALVSNYPNLVGPLAVLAGSEIVIEMVVTNGRRKVNLKFQRYIYKIYKYLHNQISSGVKVTDAIRTVYDVIEDRELKEILIKMAARYELTLDVDAALEEFRSNFDVHEAQTLCIALKQGIETGDNQELLAKQEDMMFKKYFNYIQAETDSCRNRSLAAASVFTAIVVILIVVPMLNDVGEAVGKIFVN